MLTAEEKEEILEEAASHRKDGLTLPERVDVTEISGHFLRRATLLEYSSTSATCRS